MVDSKKGWDIIGVAEIPDGVRRGHIVLLLCIDLFETKHPLCLSEISKREKIALNQKHRGLTRERLKTVVRSLTDNIIDVQKKQHKWDRFQSEDAEELLNEYVNENVDDLLKIIYRKYPNSKSNPLNKILSREECRLAAVVAHLLDLVPLAEKYLQKQMPVHHKKLLR